jgi:hypothetical protein
LAFVRLGPEHPDRARGLQQLGWVERLVGRYVAHAADVRQPERFQRLEYLTGHTSLEARVLSDRRVDLVGDRGDRVTFDRVGDLVGRPPQHVCRRPVTITVDPTEDVTDGATTVGGRREVRSKQRVASAAPKLVVGTALGDRSKQGFGAELGGQQRIASRDG